MALTYPWFLLGLLAVAIPIVIHFFELRRPQRVLFTNVGFIREIKLVTARQRKLKHLLILAARIGFVSFLVLLFCQPFIPAPEQRQQAGGVVTAIIDSSPSMAVEGEDGQALFDHAIEQADELPAVYPASARYLLPTTSNSLLTQSAFQTSLQRASISGQAKSVTSLLDKSQRVADVRQTFVFSDFQKNTFDLRAISADSLNQTYLVPLPGKRAANVYVDSVLLDDAFVRSGSDIGLRVRLRNGGALAATDCQVKVFVGNRQVAAFRAAVNAHESTASTVRVRLESSAVQQCRVEVEDFPVTFDNTYFFTLQASPQIGILNVTGPRETAVSRVYRNESMFALSNNNSQTVDYNQLNAANLIVLEEVPRLGNALQENLLRAVNQGATLVIVPPAAGPDAQGEYSHLFRGLGIGGVQWQVSPGSAPVLQDVAAPSLQNPFFQDVFSASNQRAVMPKVAPVLRWSRSGTDVLKMRNGDGFLAGFPSGKGNVYLFAAPFGAAYSNFTQHALFVPVMYRLAMRSYRSEQRLAYRLNQGTIALGVPVQGDKQQDEPVVSLRKDSSTVIPAQRWEGGSLRLTLPAAVQEPGFYQVEYNNKVLTTLALNLSKAESELSYYSAAELRQLIGSKRPNIQVYEGGTDRSVAAHYKAQRVGTPLWRYCLLLALGCLLVEVLLLRFAGSRKSQPAAAVAA
ncbi:BatA domain-containing protein [Hymenobacter cellulosilyticus]|uniref:BatA domain-containing protein n=1 Tax=Hymenobacter cellulosilyticus TaxID=2932248 RepID=A0A8T9Q8M4_9BACT|nr:BatA domain-containing protein [Hymenobacter cellulosilyticus]UOQ71879.1 BatA domain-containing protein [Hymenobacter cellulosilyticus]